MAPFDLQARLARCSNEAKQATLALVRSVRSECNALAAEESCDPGRVRVARAVRDGLGQLLDDVAAALNAA